METDSRHRSPLRVLAPLALIVFGVALVLVISSAGGGGGGGGASSSKAAQTRDLGTSAAERRAKRQRAKTTVTKSVYVVKSGDTLAGIAQTTGVPVERLQQLNPGLDQFSLVAGQRIKLR